LQFEIAIKLFVVYIHHTWSGAFNGARGSRDFTHDMIAGRICSGVMRAATDLDGPSIGFQLMEACVPGSFNGKKIMRVSRKDSSVAGKISKTAFQIIVTLMFATFSIV